MSRRPAWGRIGGVRLRTTAVDLPDAAWLGPTGFVALEGATLLICMLSYFYLRQYVESWPPFRTPRPTLAPAIAQSIVMLASWYPVHRLDRAAKRFDRERVRRLMIVVALFGLAFVALRWFELRALNVRFDANTYGAIAWTTLGLHSALLVTEVAAALWSVVLFCTPRVTERHFSAASDNAVHWYFMTSSWIVVAAMLYLVPRIG